MNIVIKMILVALAAVFPKLKKGYGMFLIILMSFISMFFFIGAALDQSAGQPDWVVRNCPSSYKVGRQSDLSTRGSGSFV